MTQCHDTQTNRRRQREEEIKNVHFSVASAKGFPGREYGLVTVLMPLHNMVI
jgi:hypothetical protein